MFFGKITVGTFIVNKDNAIVRTILKKVVLEFEEEIKYIDDGMILDDDIQLANDIIGKYIEFLL